MLKKSCVAISALLCAAALSPAAPAHAQDAGLTPLLVFAPPVLGADTPSETVIAKESWVWLHREQRTVESHVHDLVAASGADGRVLWVRWDAGSGTFLGLRSMEDAEGIATSELGVHFAGLPMDPPKDMSILGGPAVVQDTSYWYVPFTDKEPATGMASWTEVDTGVQGIFDALTPRMSPVDVDGAAAFLIMSPIGGFGPSVDIGPSAPRAWPELERALGEATSRRLPVAGLSSWPAAFLEANPNRSVYMFRGAEQDWAVHIVAPPRP